VSEPVEPTTEAFDAAYAAIANSKVYREAAHELTRVLPDWVVPYSGMTPEDAYRFVAIPIEPHETMLDVGCGLGGPGIWISGGERIIGIDRSPAAIAAARALATKLGQSERCDFRVARAEATGLPDGSISVAISIDALMFMNAAEVAREMHRVLAPRCFFAFIASEWTSDDPPPIPTVERDYDPILEAAGFRIFNRMNLDNDRGLPLFAALVAREDALLAEIGDAAKPILEEARGALAAGKPRKQDVYIEAKRL
jgi:SAM-dependent methyltransferase